MPYEDVEKFEQIAKGKIRFLEEHFGRYVLRAIMAGFFIAVAMIYSNVVGNLFSESDPAMGKFLSGICHFADCFLNCGNFPGQSAAADDDLILLYFLINLNFNFHNSPPSSAIPPFSIS